MFINAKPNLLFLQPKGYGFAKNKLWHYFSVLVF